MARHLKIAGRVQGVGFRYSMAAEAGRLGITGWVRNRRDGTVEAVVDGDPDALEGIVAWARQGPRGSQVTDVEVIEVADNFLRFEMRPTE